MTQDTNTAIGAAALNYSTLHEYAGTYHLPYNELCAVVRAALASATPQAGSQPAPIDMVLHCPACGLQHIDGREYQHGDHTAQNEAAAWNWDNPPHRSHLCHGCGHIWRPADVPTNGVRAVKSAGKADSPIAARAPADSVLEDAARYRHIRDVPHSEEVRSVLIHQQNAVMDKDRAAMSAKNGGE